MNIYSLCLTDECGTPQEYEFEAIDDDAAVVYAQKYCAGNEGLWTGIYMQGASDRDDWPVTFNPF